jgi:hypothetical protein
VGYVLAGHPTGEAQYVRAIATVEDRVGRARAVVGITRTLRAVDLEVPRVTA